MTTLEKSINTAERLNRRVVVTDRGEYRQVTIYGHDGVTPGLVATTEQESRIVRYVELLALGAEVAVFAILVGFVSGF
jgi:hypothetical protein